MSEPIKPEDIKPGDWVRFHHMDHVIIAAVLYVLTPSEYRVGGCRLDIWTDRYLIHERDVLEVRRG